MSGSRAYADLLVIDDGVLISNDLLIAIAVRQLTLYATIIIITLISVIISFAFAIIMGFNKRNDYELYRLSTYSDASWSRVPGKPCSSQLARIGFYFEPARHVITCFSCKIEFGVDEVTDDIETKHSRMSPRCGLVTKSAADNVSLVEPEYVINKYRDVPEISSTDYTDSPDATGKLASSIRKTYNELKKAFARATKSNALTTQVESSVDSVVVPPVDRENPDFERMRYEAIRLNTYSDWSARANAQPKPLAAAGFFYTGKSDRVQCAFCRGFLRNWEVGDVPETEHKKHFPDCPFVRGRDVNNVPIGGNTDALSSALQDLNLCETDRTQSKAVVQSSGTSTAKAPTGPKPKHPEFSEFQTRVKSFDGKIVPRGQDVKVLAIAGYYHVGPHDNVKCFFCDGGLKNWQPNDDPWVEHAKWFPRCGYLMSVRDANYIQAIQNTYRPNAMMQQNLPANIGGTPLALPAGTDSSDRSAAGAGQYNFEPREIKARMDSPSVKAVLSMGYSRETVRHAIQMKLATTGDDFPNAESLVEAVMVLQEQLDQGLLQSGVLPPPAAPQTVPLSSLPVGSHAAHTAASNLSEITVPASMPARTGTSEKQTAESAPAPSDPATASGAAASNKTTKSNRKKKKKKKQRGNSQQAGKGASAAANDEALADDDDDDEKEPKELMSSTAGGPAGDMGDVTAAMFDDPEARSLLEENRQLKEAKMCKVCMDDETNIVFLPCGHLACCNNCAPALRHCPICRAFIRGTVRIFLA